MAFAIRRRTPGSPRGGPSIPGDGNDGVTWVMGMMGVKRLTVVTGFFQAGVLFSIENMKNWPILADLGYFVTNLHTVWFTFTGWFSEIDRFQVQTLVHSFKYADSW